MQTNWANSHEEVLIVGVFDKIKVGLEEAIAYEQGTLKARTTKDRKSVV